MPRTIRLRWLVAALVLAIVAPLGVAASLSVQRAGRRQLANVERQNVATVRAISVAIDQQIERTTSALDVLGELHALDTPDLAAFESLAGRMLPYQPTWSAIVVASRDGRVIDGVPIGATAAQRPAASTGPAPQSRPAGPQCRIFLRSTIPRCTT